MGLVCYIGLSGHLAGGLVCYIGLSGHVVGRISLLCWLFKSFSLSLIHI